MVYLKCECVGLCSGDGAETLRERIATDGERDALCKKIPRLSRTEPLRLRRLPVEEVEIRVLLIRLRRVSDSFLFEFAKDERTSVIVLLIPETLTSQIAVRELLERRVSVPEINKRGFHNLNKFCQTDRPRLARIINSYAVVGRTFFVILFWFFFLMPFLSKDAAKIVLIIDICVSNF